MAHPRARLAAAVHGLAHAHAQPTIAGARRIRGLRIRRRRGARGDDGRRAPARPGWQLDRDTVGGPGAGRRAAARAESRERPRSRRSAGHHARPVRHGDVRCPPAAISLDGTRRWRPRGEIAGGDDDVRALFHGDLLAPRDDFRAVSVFSRARGHGVLWVLSPDRVPWWERAAPLRTMLHWSLSVPARRLLVHGAAVAGAAQGALLIGAGGCGKSTTAVACVEQGMQCGRRRLRPARRGLRASRIRSTAPRSSTRAACALLPGAALALLRRRRALDAEKRVVDLAARWPDRMARPCQRRCPRDAADRGGRSHAPASRLPGRTRCARSRRRRCCSCPATTERLLAALADLARRLPAYVARARRLAARCRRRPHARLLQAQAAA